MLAHFILSFAVLASSAAPAASEHVLAGAGAFRDGRFDVALVEFRVAEKLGAPEAGAYSAAALVKLGRAEEAVETFARSPSGDDDLLDWYRAIACYQIKLYTCTDRFLASLEHAGPKVSAEASVLRAEVRRVLAPKPSAAAVDWYLARCEAKRDAGRTALAAAFCREAADLGARTSDHHGVSRATALLSELASAQGPGGGK